MSIHIEAEKGQIAETVLLPGDPYRARFVAETFLSDSKCFNTVRGMLGYTGSYKGKMVSVMGTGMGQPSLAIYVNELIKSYGARNLIRIGSCGAYQPELKLRDIILAQTASTNSSLNRRYFKGMDFAPGADFGLLMEAYEKARSKGITPYVGNILSSDDFYNPDMEEWKLWAQYGVLAVEMESSALYTIAAREKVKALSILTVSDSLATGEETTSKERESTFRQMVEIALEIA